jgi:curved DNA-binding protein CbpA
VTVKLPKSIAEFLASQCKSLRSPLWCLASSAPAATQTVIRAAWIARISVHHPDKGGNTQAAQAVNAAYQLLSRFSQ